MFNKKNVCLPLSYLAGMHTLKFEKKSLKKTTLNKILLELYKKKSAEKYLLLLLFCWGIMIHFAVTLSVTNFFKEYQNLEHTKIPVTCINIQDYSYSGFCLEGTQAVYLN